VSDPFDPFDPADEPPPRPGRRRPPAAVPDSGFAAAAGGRLAPMDDADLAAVDAFAPLTEEELAAEARVESSLRAAGRRRLLTAGLGLVVLVGVVAGVRLVIDSLGEDDDEPPGGLVFDEVAGTAAGEEPGPPIVEPLLVARLGTLVAVLAGDGAAADRVDPAVDPALAPVPPGTVAATLFARDGSGQVLLTGPDGWLGDACVRASVVSEGLRAFDSVWYESVPGACGGLAIGRPVTPTCLGPTSLMLPLAIPAGIVELEEGGTAAADAVRLSVAAGGGPAPAGGGPTGYEEISVRGVITVPDEVEGVRIPGFGGAAGSTVEVAFGGAGAGLVATCTLA
jgi:hypothetical protein